MYHLTVSSSMDFPFTKSNSRLWLKINVALMVVVLAANMARMYNPAAPPTDDSPASYMDCQNYRAVDTATLYSFQMPAQPMTGPCNRDLYPCGTGYEWWGMAHLPAGSWRLKLKPTGNVCLDLLTSCDSVCQQVNANGPVELDWKNDLPKRYWIHLSSGQAANVIFEIGRYELGTECIPVFWGEPCDKPTNR